MTRTAGEQRAAGRRPRWGKRRSEGIRVFHETPSKRSLRGAQQVGRRDMERGVTSRARKDIQGRELMPDPRFGGRPGRRNTKWQPPRVRRRPPDQALPTAIAAHRVRVSLPEHLYEKLTQMVETERIRRREPRFSLGDKIVEIVRDYQAPRS